MEFFILKGKCMLKSKKISGSIRSGEDFLFTVGYLFVSLVLIFLVYNHLQKENYTKMKKNASVINLQEKINNIEKDNENNFLYGETNNSYIFSNTKFRELCFPNKETERKKRDLKYEELYINYSQLSQLNRSRTIALNEMYTDTEIINYHTSEYANMNCDNFFSKNNNLYYKNKPAYFLIKKP